MHKNTKKIDILIQCAKLLVYDMNKLLLMFSLIPLFCAGIIISVLLVNKSSEELKLLSEQLTEQVSYFK